MIHQALTWTNIGSLTFVQTSMHAIAHRVYGHCKRVCIESWLWEKTPLPHWGIEPASVACQSHALPTKLPPHSKPPPTPPIYYECKIWLFSSFFLNPNLAFCIWRPYSDSSILWVNYALEQSLNSRITCETRNTQMHTIPSPISHTDTQ